MNFSICNAYIRLASDIILQLNLVKSLCSFSHILFTVITTISGEFLYKKNIYKVGYIKQRINQHTEAIPWMDRKKTRHP